MKSISFLIYTSPLLVLLCEIICYKQFMYLILMVIIT